MPYRARHEHVPRGLLYRVQDSEVADPLILQLLHKSASRAAELGLEGQWRSLLQLSCLTVSA